MGKLDLERFKQSAEAVLQKKQTQGIFKEQRDVKKTIDLDDLDVPLKIRLFETDLLSLQNSIATLGQVSPIIVRQNKDRYDVLDGNRRIAAVRALGLTDIAADIIDVNDEDALFLPYMLNGGFDLIEMVAYVQKLRQTYGIDDTMIAERTGIAVKQYSYLFHQLSSDPINDFNTHFLNLLHQKLKMKKGEFDIERNGIRLKFSIEKDADTKAQAELYRFLHRLSEV